MTSPKTSLISVKRTGYALQAEVRPHATADAPWIVFGNSLLTDMSIWDEQVRILGKKYSILRYDQAGHGTSDVPPQGITFDDLGQDLLAVMDAAQVDRAVYTGLSMGVPTGLAACHSAPARFSALVFSDGQARTASGGATGWAERIASAETHGMRAFAEATADRWLVNAAAPLRTRLIDMLAATPYDGFKACATALMQYDYTSVLGEITCPTLLIAGAQDGAIPTAMATHLQPAIAQSHLHIIENAGHVPCFEQPDAFNGALLTFMGAGR